MLPFWALVLQLFCQTMAIPSVQGFSLEGESLKRPREIFERSIPDSGPEERMKELLDNLKAEVLEKFQEQEEKNAEQDLKISRQSETILKLEETIAEQQKTIEDQNETIQMIASHLDLGTRFEAPSTPQEDQLPQESVLYITGRYNDSNTEPTTEIYPSHQLLHGARHHQPTLGGEKNF